MGVQQTIALDMSSVGERLTGAGRMLLNVLDQLPRVAPRYAYVALVTEAGRDIVHERVPEATSHIVHVRSGVHWELRGAGDAAAAVNAAALFTVRELVPLHGPPVVLHVFEPPSYRLRALNAPSTATARRVAKDVFLTAAFPRSVRRARRVTAGSVATAEWLATHVGVAADVIISGIDPVFFAESASADRSAAPYVLHPASGDPRENTGLVLEAMRSVPGVRLVVFGTPPEQGHRLAERARDLGVELEVAGWVSDGELRKLYAGAAALVHPSKYESYAGYPVLEAMALGTPVVALAAPGVTEAIPPERGLLIQREDASDLAEAIRRLLDDPSLAEHLAIGARAHVQTLTWETAATQLAAAFDRAVAS